MKNLFKSLNKRPIAYYPAYAEITGSVKAGILLSQIMYWHEAMKEEPFYKREPDWLEELAMNRKEFRNARATLEKLGLITVEVQGNKRETYYWPEVEKIIEKVISIVPKGNNGKCRKGIMQNAETAQCTYTETTTETTTESVARHTPQSFEEWFDKDIGKVRIGLENDRRRFINYWTEKSPNGKKMRWQKQPTFDITLRWNTWIRKKEEYENKKERERKEHFIKQEEIKRGVRREEGLFGIAELIKERTS